MRRGKILPLNRAGSAAGILALVAAAVIVAAAAYVVVQPQAPEPGTAPANNADEGTGAAKGEAAGEEFPEPPQYDSGTGKDFMVDEPAGAAEESGAGDAVDAETGGSTPPGEEEGGSSGTDSGQAQEQPPAAEPASDFPEPPSYDYSGGSDDFFG